MKKLRLLIIDCYSLNRRIQFYNHNIEFASKLYSNFLTKNYKDKFNYDVIYPCNQNLRNLDLNNYIGAIWTGSSHSVYNKNEEVDNCKYLLNRIIDNNINSFGSCFALQLFAHQLGGNVTESKKGYKIGISRNIKIENQHYIYNQKNDSFNAFSSHNDSVVKISKYGTILAKNEHSIQSAVFNVNNTELVGVQYHPEYNINYFGKYLYLRKKKFKKLIFHNNILFNEYVNFLYNYNENENNREYKNIFGITNDLINEENRTLEIKNWLDNLYNLKI